MNQEENHKADPPDPLGTMPVPEDFAYRELCRRERPRHGPTDRFSVRHPRMDPGRRAKIFAPFDALRGFNAAIIAETGRSLEAARTPDDKEELWE